MQGRYWHGGRLVFLTFVGRWISVVFSTRLLTEDALANSGRASQQNPPKRTYATLEAQRR